MRCPFCGSSVYSKLIPPEGHSVVLTTINYKEENLRPSSAIKVNVMVCGDCKKAQLEVPSANPIFA